MSSVLSLSSSLLSSCIFSSISCFITFLSLSLSCMACLSLHLLSCKFDVKFLICFCRISFSPHLVLYRSLCLIDDSGTVLVPFVLSTLLFLKASLLFSRLVAI
uniref:Uncharacterized protein n=1 Tax=Cacopsylla melanoneura TaxID=428564 RepID=A0A8D8QGQ9_9HEMI